MLLRFYVSNFRSFFEEVEFNTFPGDYKIHKDHIYFDKKQKVALLKTAAVYGANGSGKSNFIKAVHFLHDLATKEDLLQNDVACTPYRLDSGSIAIPSEFGLECMVGKKYYEYSVSILDGVIAEESLYETFPGAGEAKLVFLRSTKEGQTHIDVNPQFAQTEKDRYRFEIYGEDLKPTQSLLYKVRDTLEDARALFNWFEHNLWVIYPGSRYALTARLCVDGTYKKFLNELLPKLGTGMTAVDVQSIPFADFFGADDEAQKTEFEKMLSHEKGLVVFTKHHREFVARKNGDKYEVNQVKTYNADKAGALVEFEPDEQSDGTQRIMDLIPAIHQITNQPSVFFIDEIDRSLHPSIIKELLRYYMSTQSQGQLIFTTHESNLLDLEIFRQDEIWLTEKKQDGQSIMYPLSDFKPRYDLDIQKGYLKGRFGAIPFLGNLQDLNWQHAKKQALQKG